MIALAAVEAERTVGAVVEKQRVSSQDLLALKHTKVKVKVNLEINVGSA